MHRFLYTSAIINHKDPIVAFLLNELADQNIVLIDLQYHNRPAKNLAPSIYTSAMANGKASHISFTSHLSCLLHNQLNIVRSSGASTQYSSTRSAQS